MSKQESKAAYERALSIAKSAGSIPQEYGWSPHYRDKHSSRTVRTYLSGDAEYRVIELLNRGLGLELKMHRVPPDDANLEFANVIMDAAEKLIREGKKEK